MYLCRQDQALRKTDIHPIDIIMTSRTFDAWAWVVEVEVIVVRLVQYLDVVKNKKRPIIFLSVVVCKTKSFNLCVDVKAKL